MSTRVWEPQPAGLTVGFVPVRVLLYSTGMLSKVDALFLCQLTSLGGGAGPDGFFPCPDKSLSAAGWEKREAGRHLRSLKSKKLITVKREGVTRWVRVDHAAVEAALAKAWFRNHGKRAEESQKGGG